LNNPAAHVFLTPAARAIMRLLNLKNKDM